MLPDWGGEGCSFPAPYLPCVACFLLSPAWLERFTSGVGTFLPPTSPLSAFFSNLPSGGSGSLKRALANWTNMAMAEEREDYVHDLQTRLRLALASGDERKLRGLTTHDPAREKKTPQNPKIGQQYYTSPTPQIPYARRSKNNPKIPEK